MSDRITEIKERWAEETVLQCTDWWYSAVRHVQRNMDEMCKHESWSGVSVGEISDEEYSATHPDRYDGTRHAHAGADIAYLLGFVRAGTELYEHDGEARTSNGEYVSASEALQNAIEWGMCRVGRETTDE